MAEKSFVDFNLYVEKSEEEKRLRSDEGVKDKNSNTSKCHGCMRKRKRSNLSMNQRRTSRRIERAAREIRTESRRLNPNIPTNKKGRKKLPELVKINRSSKNDSENNPIEMDNSCTELNVTSLEDDLSISEPEKEYICEVQDVTSSEKNDVYLEQNENNSICETSIPSISDGKIDRNVNTDENTRQVEMDKDVINVDNPMETDVKEYLLEYDEECDMEIDNLDENNPEFDVTLDDVPNKTNDSESKQFEQKCLDELTDPALWIGLIEALSSQNLLYDFMLTIRQLSTEVISILSPIFLMLLDVARWNNCKTTTNMRYHPITFKIWSVFYVLCGGAGINFFRGFKNENSVVLKETTRGLYHPANSRINFAVPDVRHLRKKQQVLPKEINPGLIQPSLEMVQNKTDLVLMADGKSLARGLRGKHDGEVNLWGHEGPASLKQLDTKLENILDFLTTMKSEYRKMTKENKRYNLMRLMKELSLQIKYVRQYQLLERKKLLRYQKCSQTNVKSYSKAISSCKVYIFNAQVLISKILSVNKNICKILSTLGNNNHMFTTDDQLKLSDQANVRLLHNTDSVELHYDLKEYPNLVKPKSQEWKSIRKESVITDATAYNGCGLRSMKAHSDHFDEFIYDKKCELTTAEKDIQKYAAEQEINALGTLAGILMPAILPTCAKLYEEGPTIRDGQVRESMISICPDGFIRHDHNDNDCGNCHVQIEDHEDITVEVKSPYPNSLRIPVEYKIRVDDIIQCMLQMRAKESKRHWYLSSCKVSTVLIEMEYNEELSDQICKLIMEIFDKKKPAKLKRVTDIQREFKRLLDEVQLMYTDLVCEVPTVNCEEGTLEILAEFYPYHIPRLIPEQRLYFDSEDLDVQAMSNLETSETVIKESFDIVRNEATEILAFVVSDIHRVQNPNIPSHLPIAYALKGTSLSNQTMRKLINDVRDGCKSHNVGIACEVYDGQHFNLVFRSEYGEPLSRFQLLKDIWNPMCNWDKTKCMNFLSWYTKVSSDDLEELSLCTLPRLRTSNTFGNIAIYFRQRSDGTEILTAQTSGGEEYYKLKMTDIKTPSRPDIWEKDLIAARNETTDNKSQEVVRNLSPQEIDLILKGTKSGRRRQARLTQGPLIDTSDEDHAENDPDYDPDQDELVHTDEDIDDDETFLELTSMLDPEPNLDTSGDFIHMCLAALQKFDNRHEWSSLDACDLFDRYLSSSNNIRKLFTYEMDAICDVIFIFTGIQIFTKSSKKEHKVKQLCMNLGNNMDWITNSTIQETFIELSVPSLKYLSRQAILHSSYSKNIVRVAVANSKFKRAVQKWEDNATVPVSLSLPGLIKDHTIYSFPEFSCRRLQIEIRTLDYSHILSNIRTHLCKHGYDNVPRDALIRVSEENHELLPRCLIEDMLDKQNIGIAERIFSKGVEDAMIKNGDTSAAQFIHMIRNWYESCDERGLPFHDRLNQMQQVFDYIMDEFDALQFPPVGRAINQMPLSTYEAILQNISTRFILYAIRSKGFSNRAISTLDIESFFSDLTKLEFTGLGLPKAVDIPRLMKKAVFINNIKHDPNRGFELKTSSRSTYPYHLMECSNVNSLHTFSSKLHNVLDTKRKRSKRKKWDNIAKPKSVTRGGTTIRTKYFKYDENLIDMEKRAGITVDIDLTNV